MSPRTAEHMIWHQSHDAVDGVMVHLLTAKRGNTLIVCILTFQLNQEMCVWVLYRRIQPIRVILLTSHTDGL
jgi:hypothetical protein